MELQLLQAGKVLLARPIGRRPLYLGRAPINDLVLGDDQVSGHHAVLWRQDGRVWVRDLGSTNGTFVNGEGVEAPRTVASGDELRIGPTVVLRVVGRLDPAEEEVDVRLGALLLEDLAAGTASPIRSDRFRLGDAPDADVRIPGCEVDAVLLVHADGSVSLGVDDEDRGEVALDQPFEIGGRSFRLRHRGDALPRTEDLQPTRYAYRLEASLQGPAGAVATIEDPRSGRRYELTSENRAVLLFVLARRLLRDREEGRAEGQVGWCDDREVSIAIWGRAWSRQGANNYHVLLCRLRKELRAAGFDAWFIEKSRGSTRLRLEEVVVRED